MLLLFILLFAAVLCFGGFSLPRAHDRALGGARRDGMIIVGAVLVAVMFGLLASDFRTIGTPNTRLAIGEAPLLLVAGGLYLLASLRGRFQLPTWISDVLVLGAATLSLSLSTSTPLVWGATTVLTIGWMWMLARMTAALNRTPQVTGGYIGLVAVALLVLMHFQSPPDAPVFARAVCAALAGAGLATVPFALRNPQFNIGWATSLTLGFLIAQAAALGFIQSAAFFILFFSIIAFGLPLLDVSFLQIRASLRGQEINVEEQRYRLHEALLRRGVAPMKITLLYLVMGTWFCVLGVLASRLVVELGIPIWLIVLRILGLFFLFFTGLVAFISLARVWMRRGEHEVIPEEIEAFGVRISPVSMHEAMDKIEGFIRSGQPHHVVTSDANSILRAQEDDEYAAIVRRAALIAPDGFGVVWGARLMNLPIYERVTGVDMVTGICQRAAKNGFSIYILGSEPGIAATAAEKLAERYPGLRVAGTQHGFWKRDGISDEEIVQRIHDAKPDVLFVAFGIPAQEKFIAQHFDALKVPVSLGVGGSFDVYSEKLKRAPEYIQRSGLEWIYRVWQEPWRWKRMSYVPRFMMFALRVWIFGSRPASPPKN